MQPTVSKLRFRYGQASAAELQLVVDEVLAELGDQTSEAADRARRAGLDPEELTGAQVDIREEQQGLKPISTTILVSIATGVGTHIATKLWDDVIWPRNHLRPIRCRRRPEDQSAHPVDLPRSMAWQRGLAYGSLVDECGGTGHRIRRIARRSIR
jgi:hypothetical protein